VDLRELKTKYKLRLVFWSVMVSVDKIIFIVLIKFDYLFLYLFHLRKNETIEIGILG
jgi:hypothetical protein